MDSWSALEKGKSKMLFKEFAFPDFEVALAFVNKVGYLAEESRHHPDIELGWGYVRIWLTTHSERKITSKDQSLAQAIDQIPR